MPAKINFGMCVDVMIPCRLDLFNHFVKLLEVNCALYGCCDELPETGDGMYTFRKSVFKPDLFKPDLTEKRHPTQAMQRENRSWFISDTLGRKWKIAKVDEFPIGCTWGRNRTQRFILYKLDRVNESNTPSVERLERHRA